MVSPRACDAGGEGAGSSAGGQRPISRAGQDGTSRPAVLPRRHRLVSVRPGDRDGGLGMTFMAVERATLERFMPGLDDELGKLTLGDLERPGNPALAAFKAAGGPGMLVPA